MIKDLINFKNGCFYKYCPFEDDTNRLRTYFYWDKKCTKTFNEKGMELTISNALIVDRDMSSQRLVIESPYKITFLSANHILDRISEVSMTEVSDIYTRFHKTLQCSIPQKESQTMVLTNYTRTIFIWVCQNVRHKNL